MTASRRLTRPWSVLAGVARFQQVHQGRREVPRAEIVLVIEETPTAPSRRRSTTMVPRQGSWWTTNGSTEVAPASARSAPATVAVQRVRIVSSTSSTGPSNCTSGLSVVR